MEFIDLKTDWAFKKVFGSEESKDILTHFLNAIIKPKVKIVSIALNNPYNPTELEKHKDTFVDVKATLEDGSKVIIEMQVIYHKNFFERLMVYTSKNYGEQLLRGDKYIKLNPVTAIAIIAFDDYPIITEHHHHFCMVDTKNMINYPDTIDLHILSLNNFIKEEESCSNTEEKYLYCIKQAGTINRMPSFNDKIIERALKMANKATLSDEELDLIERRADFIRLTTAAKTDAVELGIAQGIEQGIEQGEVKGKIEEKTNIIQEMLKNGCDWDFIRKITKISHEEYDKLVTRKL